MPHFVCGDAAGSAGRIVCVRGWDRDILLSWLCVRAVEPRPSPEPLPVSLQRVGKGAGLSAMVRVTL